MINDSEYGGFIVSNNVLLGYPIRYTYRNESKIKELNGWTILSIKDDDAFVSNPQNFVILSATSIKTISPVMLEIFPAKYGTDLCWLYEEDVHVGFYDLKTEKETTIDEILK
ncbi:MULTISPECIES: DUF2185 domain-containing protein [Streptococcus]|uniref:DUF2185 domain-containing protein n=1 Tax=Streptococcus TaxID=1301 RepID=UPI00215C3C75|nr:MULTISPECIES: DUF2185 domain-containing protein [Streptococcus]MCR8967273.1 DUF2185 domain-containing protein [Streptococcus zalophi]MCU9533313.1 DUF2185 domain-containing protein [Streptococcus sp. CSL10205-OR2]